MFVQFKKTALLIISITALFAANQASAFVTIITGSYSEQGYSKAEARLAEPAFIKLGAFKLPTRSRSFKVRVAVGCYNSIESATKEMQAVRDAGAKGIWLLDIGNKCVSPKFLKTSMPKKTASLEKAAVIIEKKALEKKAILEKTASLVMSKKTIAISDSGENNSPNIIYIDDVPFKPTKWKTHDGTAIAYTSGANIIDYYAPPKGQCMSIIEHRVASFDSVKPPTERSDYQGVNENHQVYYSAPICYFAHVYIIN